MDLVTVPTMPRDRVAAGFDLSEPFTPSTAARAGLGRSALERLVREGQVVRLVRGVYVDAATELPSLTRARALALVLGRKHLVVDRTAAWVHGAPALRAGTDAPIPLDVLGRKQYPGPQVPVDPDEITVLGGVRCTSPVRTALDVARHLAPERALPLLDGLIRAGALAHHELIAAAAEADDHLPGVLQARELAAIADGRAANVSETVLRLHWLGAQLPTPAPGWRVGGVRLALALPVHRFGVVLVGESRPIHRDAIRRTGWTLVALDELRVRRSDPAAVAGHLEREFHRHLLEQMGET